MYPNSEAIEMSLMFEQKQKQKRHTCIATNAAPRRMTPTTTCQPLMHMMITVERMFDPMSVSMRTFIGIVESALSTSLLRRFVTRPIGVVSKNAIGARTMRAKRRECSTSAPWHIAYARVVDMSSTNRAVHKTKHNNT